MTSGMMPHWNGTIEADQTVPVRKSTDAHELEELDRLEDQDEDDPDRRHDAERSGREQAAPRSPARVDGAVGRASGSVAASSVIGDSASDDRSADPPRAAGRRPSPLADGYLSAAARASFDFCEDIGRGLDVADLVDEAC